MRNRIYAPHQTILTCAPKLGGKTPRGRGWLSALAWLALAALAGYLWHLGVFSFAASGAGSRGPLLALAGPVSGDTATEDDLEALVILLLVALGTTITIACAVCAGRAQEIRRLNDAMEELKSHPLVAVRWDDSRFKVAMVKARGEAVKFSPTIEKRTECNAASGGNVLIPKDEESNAIRACVRELRDIGFKIRSAMQTLSLEDGLDALRDAEVRNATARDVLQGILDSRKAQPAEVRA